MPQFSVTHSFFFQISVCILYLWGKFLRRKYGKVKRTRRCGEWERETTVYKNNNARGTMSNLNRLKPYNVSLFNYECLSTGWCVCVCTYVCVCIISLLLFVSYAVLEYLYFFLHHWNTTYYFIHDTIEPMLNKVRACKVNFILISVTRKIMRLWVFNNLAVSLAEWLGCCRY